MKTTAKKNSFEKYNSVLYALFVLSFAAFALFCAGWLMIGRGPFFDAAAICTFVAATIACVYLVYRKHLLKTLPEKGSFSIWCSSILLACYTGYQFAHGFYQLFFSGVLSGTDAPHFIKRIYDSLPLSEFAKHILIKGGMLCLGALFIYLFLILFVFALHFAQHGLLTAAIRQGYIPASHAKTFFTWKHQQKALRGNLPFLLSALSFYLLYASFGGGRILITIVAGAAALYIASLFPDLHKGVKPSFALDTLSGLNALGTSVAGAVFFVQKCLKSNLFASFSGLIGIDKGALSILLACALSVGSLWFLFVLMRRLYDWLFVVLRHCFNDTFVYEKIALSCIVLAFCAFAAFAFYKSNAFYGAKPLYDIIYSTDSPALMKNNTYLNLNYNENDIRQPLFAVFAAPFTGIGYLCSLPAGASFMGALCMNIPQLVLLALSCYMLSKLLGVDNPLSRIGLLIAFCSLYSTLLFSIVMEQYIVSLFWLMVLIYVSIHGLPGRLLAFMGAGGTLLTSVALIPLMREEERFLPVKKDLPRYVFIFCACLLALLFFHRLDVFLNLKSKIGLFLSFSGGTVPFGSRALQYLCFVASCFFAPGAGIDTVTQSYISWQLQPAAAVSLAGACILGLSILGFVLNRRDRFVKISAGWVLFSFLLLCVVGWGSPENGMILYSLYFGWAFFALIIKLLQTMLKAFKCEAILPVVTLLMAAMLLLANIGGMGELIRFAAEHYPT